MRVVLCPSCSAKAKKFGHTKAGTQRFRCSVCKLTFTHSYSTRTKRFEEFLTWLLGKMSQEEMCGRGRAFRRRCSEFWEIWPVAEVTGEMYEVIYVDGIRIADNLRVLIASSDTSIVGWYVCQTENSFAWASLLGKIPAPRMVVSDGGSGFQKACRLAWPNTRIQRCLVHVAAQIRRYTTRKPQLEAGKELLALVNILAKIKTKDQATTWLVDYHLWCNKWEEFLSEKTRNPETGRIEWTHDRLVKARNSLNTLVRSKTLFTYLDPELEDLAKLPCTNNRAESVNASLREMLRLHRGLSKLKRVKAIFWWCYLHSELVSSYEEMLRRLPTDADIDRLCAEYTRSIGRKNQISQWGDALVWTELRQQLPWRDEWSM